jgi:glycosyltransferase 2 family protein
MRKVFPRMPRRTLLEKPREPFRHGTLSDPSQTTVSTVKQNPSPRQRLLLRTLLGLAITAGLFTFLLRYIDPQQIGQLFARTRWSLCLVGLGLWAVIYLVRARRFIKLAPRTPYLTMLCIAAVHNFLLRLLPLRTGELAYAFLVKRAGTAGLGESIISLLLLRIMDSTLVVILFAVALTFHHGTYLGDRRYGVGAALSVAVLGLLIIFTLAPLLRLALGLTRYLLGLLGLLHRPRLRKLLEQGDQAVDSFARVKRAAIYEIALLSTIQWLLTFGAFFAMMRAFSMPVGIAQTTLGSTAAVVAGFLPIGGIGSFGTLEAGWALGFALVGLEKTQAIASGFGVSITTFGYGAILGLLGWVGLAMISKRTKRREDNG